MIGTGSSPRSSLVYSACRIAASRSCLADSLARLRSIAYRMHRLRVAPSTWPLIEVVLRACGHGRDAERLVVAPVRTSTAASGARLSTCLIPSKPTESGNPEVKQHADRASGELGSGRARGSAARTATPRAGVGEVLAHEEGISLVILDQEHRHHLVGGGAICGKLEHSVKSLMPLSRVGLSTGAYSRRGNSGVFDGIRRCALAGAPVGSRRLADAQQAVHRVVEVYGHDGRSADPESWS